jgi:hypothetical protein
MKLIIPALFALLSITTTFFAGCAASADSSASMASISSISASISGTAVAGTEYQNDVRIATAAAVESGASSSDLLRNVTTVASKHGISDWEAESATYAAIGEGLRIGGADAATAEDLARQLTGNNNDARRILLQAYHA